MIHIVDIYNAVHAYVKHAQNKSDIGNCKNALGIDHTIISVVNAATQNW